jgi:hypothetical protein
MTDRVELTQGGKPVKHGSASSYNNHGCRCDDCKKAWANYMRERMRTYRANKKKGKKGNGVRVNL